MRTLLGRRRLIPELSSRDPTERAHGERMALNNPIQGTAADLSKLAMLAIDPLGKKTSVKPVGNGGQFGAISIPPFQLFTQNVSGPIRIFAVAFHSGFEVCCVHSN